MELVLLKCHSSREAFPIGTGMLQFFISYDRNYGLSMQEVEEKVRALYIDNNNDEEEPKEPQE